MRSRRIPYPAEGFLRLDLFRSNQFQPADVVLQPPFIQSFESGNLIVFHGYNELGKKATRHSSEESR